MQQPSSSGYWYSGTVSSDPGSSSSLQSLPYPSSGLPAPKDVGSSAVSNYGVAYAASQYDGSAPGGSYSAGYGFVSAPQDENRSSGSATSYVSPDENPQPVFSDVSDLEPVYAFSSRSSYQRGRALFAQTRYIPGPPVYPPMPVSRSISKVSSKQSTPAKAPSKGGF